MYLVAICDDEEEELDKNEKMLKIYEKRYLEESFVIRRFSNAKELLCTVKETGYMPDLLFMDIYMPGKPGIEAAEELRKMGSVCKIIFLTSSKEFALEAFRVDAAQYLVKPLPEKELFSILDKLLGSIQKERKKYLMVRSGGRFCRVTASDIVYCEAQKKSQHMYLADGTQFLLRMTMAKIYEMLSPYREFVKAGNSYIINLEHMVSLNASKMQMDNGRSIYLPRGSYQSLKAQYFEYYCEED